MKIGLVCPYNITKGGGVQEHIFAVEAELRSRGHDAYILTPQPRDTDPEPHADHIIFVGGSADFSSPTHTTLQLSASVGDSINEVLEREQFDILHFHEPWVPMMSFQMLSRSHSVNIGTFHGTLPESLMSRTVGKVVMPYAKSVIKYIDVFTAVSDAAAEYIGSLTDKPIAIVPNGIDLERYKAPKVFRDKRRHKTIFYVGRLENRKGVKYLLHAFKLLAEQRPEVSLTIAGDGVDRAKLEMLAADLHLDDRVTFLGHITDAEKLKLLRNSDLFCAPALYGESFGIVLLEAMASGLVTVAGDNPGYAGVMRGLGQMSLVNPRHSAEFARRLDLLLHEVDLRKLWRTWALNEVKQYSYTKVVGQYEEVYKDALRNHG